MNEIYFVDTTLRDAHQSLWAEGMTTSMMLSVASQLDRVGFRAADTISLSMFKKAVVELHEDPWERIHVVAQKMPKTRRAMMTGYTIRPFTVSPLSIVKLFYERIAAHGIQRAQMMHPSNDLTFKIPHIVKFCRELGIDVVLALSYSVSPRHTDEHYAQKTRDAAKLKPDVIYLKDQGGLLTLERIKTIIPAILQNANGIPVELHSHCTTGLAPLCYLEAVKLGIKTLHTAIPPLAHGSSQPSVFNVVRNLRFLGYTPAIDEEAMKPIEDQLRYIAKKERLPIGVPLEYDVYQYIHQVPGGVISNLRHQLSKLGMTHRLDEVLREAIEVRKDLGYPIMVTPYSQFVVTQATMNVMLQERYKQVIDEIIQLALGYWGKEAGSAIEPHIMDRIMSMPRAKELSKFEPPEPSVEELRQKLGAPGISDDDLLLRYMQIDERTIKAMRASGPAKEYPTATTPLVTLIRELAKQKGNRYVYVSKKDFSLTLQKKDEKAAG